MAQYVTVGTNGTILTSTDGVSWVLRFSNTVSTLLASASISGKYVAGGVNLSICYSTDGVKWDARFAAPSFPIANNYNWNSVMWDSSNSRFLAIAGIAGNATYLGQSSNSGNTWTVTRPVSEVLSRAWTRIGPGPGGYAIIGAGYAMVSTDAVTWTGGTALVPNSSTSFAFTSNENIIVYFNYQSATYYTSTNGTAWTARTITMAGYTNSSLFWRALDWHGDYFLAMCDSNGASAYSTDGITWTQTAPPGANYCASTRQTSTNIRVAVAGVSGFATTSATRTTDLVTWTAITMPFSAVWTSVTANDNIFVAVASAASSAATSTDGITWTSRTMPGALDWRKVVWNGSVFLATAAATTYVAVSTDGISWGTVTNASINNINTVNSSFIACLSNGTVIDSTDGLTWSKARATTVTTALNSIAYGNNTYVAAGVGGVIVSSTDMVTWTTRTSSTVQALNSVAYGNGLFVAVGANSATITSTDGVTWVSRTAAIASRTLTHVSYTGNAFIVTDTTGSIHRSLNGISWISTYTGPAGLYDTVYSSDNNSIVSVGLSGTIVRSSI